MSADRWVLVPVEPTPQMMNIARGALAKRNLWGVWKAMLAAAPAAPEPHIDGWPLYSGLPPAAPAAEPSDTDRIEALERWLEASGRVWLHRNSLDFDCRQTVRQQIDANLLTWAAPAAEAVGWQPIETASREDGQHVLLHGDGENFEDCTVVGYWDEDKRRWMPFDGFALMRPTHWMPLPAAPGATPAPAQSREPLAEGEVFKILVQLMPDAVRLPPGFLDFARAIERAHDITEETTK